MPNCAGQNIHSLSHSKNRLPFSHLIISNGHMKSSFVMFFSLKQAEYVNWSVCQMISFTNGPIRWSWHHKPGTEKMYFEMMSTMECHCVLTAYRQQKNTSWNYIYFAKHQSKQQQRMTPQNVFIERHFWEWTIIFLYLECKFFSLE